MANTTRVPITAENVQKCLCGQCPVQANSQCVKQNAEKMGNLKTLDPQIVPGLYCSSGVATCKDIDTSRSCICGGCEVYNSYRLGSREIRDHFCKNGYAR